MSNQEWAPVTFEHCDHVKDPSITERSRSRLGDRLIPGFGSNFQQGRVSNNNIYFTALVDTAAWGANWRRRWRGATNGDIYVVKTVGFLRG